MKRKLPPASMSKIIIAIEYAKQVAEGKNKKRRANFIERIRKILCEKY